MLLVISQCDIDYSAVGCLTEDERTETGGREVIGREHGFREGRLSHYHTSLGVRSTRDYVAISCPSPAIFGTWEGRLIPVGLTPSKRIDPVGQMRPKLPTKSYDQLIYHDSPQSWRREERRYSCTPQSSNKLFLEIGQCVYVSPVVKQLKRLLEIYRVF